MITGNRGLGSLGSLGDGAFDPNLPTTDLPSSELLLSSNWGEAQAPTLALAPIPAARSRSFAHAPTSPMDIPGDVPQTYAPLFPPPTTGGGIETLFGFQLPTWLPKWAAVTALVVGGAFAADFAFRKMGGRRLATNPKGRRALSVGGDDDDDVEDDDVDNRLVQKARKFRKEFHWGIPAKKISRRKVSKRPKVLTELGEMTEVTYKTHKRGEKARFFTHDFEGKKPTLAMDIENERLHIVGGDYTVKADGITG